MAWSDPGDFTSGQILTAAQMDAVREAMFFGQATFTNEAARDAAIPATGISLQEGMRAYLTAPTVPAATGDTTAVPTGIQTIYNGSAWVCVTPVSARTDASGSYASGTFGTGLGGSPGTNPSVTLSTGTSALVHFVATMDVNVQPAILSFAVSGATTIAASDNYCAQSGSSVPQTTGRTFVLTGLTAGTNTFTLQYRNNGTANYQRRAITVQAIA